MTVIFQIGKMQQGDYLPFDVVRVPFPFSDIPNTTKKRPALILSSYENFGAKIGHSVLAMITSARHSSFPLDTAISDNEDAGLPKECIVRMKLFTIDNRIIEAKVGSLSQKDCKKVKNSLKQLFPDF